MEYQRSGRLPEKIARRLRLPLIAAPMLAVSGPELAIAACKAGVIGAFPLANARSASKRSMRVADENRGHAAARRPNENPDRPPAPFCPNLIIKRAEMKAELACLLRHQIEVVITSVGSPTEAVGPLHDIGCAVFADVATIKHTEKAIAAGVDGLVLLTAGAGGQTGWLNPLAFVRAAREIFEGPIVLAGGISDGAALWAAEVLGCDLAYMGTKFIATNESMAADAYKRMLVESDMDDVMLTQAFTGLDTNMLTPSMIASGLDPRTLPPRVSVEEAARNFGSKGGMDGPRRYKDIWSAGHSVSGVTRIQSAADLVEQTIREYEDARERTRAMLSDR